MPAAGTLTKKKKTFGSRLWNDISQQGKKKTRNSDFSVGAKAEIRRNVLAEIGAESARVLDLFAGAGEMYQATWKDAAHYVGCDLEWFKDERLCYVVDNRRLMRTLDLQGFNIFDMDHYGSPWEHAWMLMRLREIKPGERVGVVLTEGSNLNVRMGGIPMALRGLAGVRPGMAGAGTAHDEIIDRALRALLDRWCAKQIRQWRARHKTGSQMRYIGMVIEGISR